MESTFSDKMVMVVSLVIAVAGTIDRVTIQESEESPSPKADKLPADLVHRWVEDLRVGEQGFISSSGMWVHKDLTVWIHKENRVYSEKNFARLVLVKFTEDGCEVVIHKDDGEYPTWRPEDLEKKYGLFRRKVLIPAVKVTKASE